MRNILLSSACVLALVSNMAQAEEGQWYAGVDGSYSILDKEKANNTVLDIKEHFNDGWAVGGTIGYDFGPIRLEGEVGKHFHTLDNLNVINAGGLSLGGVGTIPASSGKSRLTSYMMNAVYDFGTVTENNSVEPFIGGGAGVADMKLSNFATATGAFVNDVDMVFAYQAFAGFRLPLLDTLEMSLKYRYLATAKANMFDSLNSGFKNSYKVHDVVLGVTYRFGGTSKATTKELPQPVALPVAEPAPVVVKPVPVKPKPAPLPVVNKGPYVVYFDFDSNAITPAANDIILKAASEAKKGKNIEIMLAGYADRSGPTKYNAKLSNKRAQSVKAAFVNAGVDSSKVSVESFGEEHNAVATKNGTKEMKNRRVVILLK